MDLFADLDAQLAAHECADAKELRDVAFVRAFLRAHPSDAQQRAASYRPVRWQREIRYQAVAALRFALVRGDRGYVSWAGWQAASTASGRRPHCARAAPTSLPLAGPSSPTPTCVRHLLIRSLRRLLGTGGVAPRIVPTDW